AAEASPLFPYTTLFRSQRGVGFAVGFKNIAYSEGFDDYCAARVRILADGSAEVHCAAAEVGQGVTGVILQVARTELGIEDVRLRSEEHTSELQSRSDLV